MWFCARHLTVGRAGDNKYKIITYSRQSRSGGGLALIYKDKYVVEELEKGQNKSFEYLICSIKIRGTTVTLVIIYHPGYSKACPVTVTTFIDEFVQFIPNIIMNFKNTVILGDFNLHLDTNEPSAICGHIGRHGPDTTCQLSYTHSRTHSRSNLLCPRQLSDSA